MLSKGRRLRAEEVRDTLRRGRSLRATYISAKYIGNSLPLRSAAVVKKTLAKGAVERNRLRRSLYEALRTADFLPQGQAVIFIDRIPQGVRTAEFRDDLVRLFSTR